MNRVPNEVILTVLKFLDAESLCLLSTVNRKWCDLVRNDCLWKPLCERALVPFPADLLDVSSVKSSPWRDIYVQLLDFLVPGTTASVSDPLPSAYIGMAWGPRTGGYWIEEPESESIVGRALHLTRGLWWFGVNANKRVHRSGDYAAVWRLKLDTDAIVETLEFKLSYQPSTEITALLSESLQEERLGRDWFYVILPGYRIPQPTGRFVAKLERTHGGVKEGYWLDFFALVPMCLMQATPELELRSDVILLRLP